MDSERTILVRHILPILDIFPENNRDIGGNGPMDLIIEPFSPQTRRYQYMNKQRT